MIESVVISRQVQNTWLQEIKLSPKIETGGILCGYYVSNSIFIDSVSSPGSRSSQSAIEFEMDEDFMVEFLDTQYSQTSGKNIYVGEWHSHPQVHPLPSEQDIQSMYERIIEWQHGEIVFIIIGFIALTRENLHQQIIALTIDIESNYLISLPIKFE